MYIKMKTPAGKLFRQENIELFSENDDSDFENDEVEKINRIALRVK